MTSRLRSLVPAVMLEVVENRRQRDVLIAGSLAVLAAGLLPRTLSPSMPSMQALLRAQPEIASALVLGAFLSSANSIGGGVVGDLWRKPAALLVGLAILFGGEIASIIFSTGLIYYVAQFSAVVGAGLVIAVGIGSIALAYEGTARATALGMAYGVYGLGTAVAPAVALLLGPLGPYWPAYALAAVAAVAAFVGVRRWRPELPGKPPIGSRGVIEVGLWGIALLAVITGLLAFSGSGNNLIQFALILGGIAVLVLLAVLQWGRPDDIRGMPLGPRQMSAAVAVGGVVGFTQTIPLVLLPAVFLYVLRYDPPILATAAIAPFAIALIAAGPVAGILLSRYSPRAILLAGTSVLGLGAIFLGLAFGLFRSGTGYVWLILPLAAIGAGFVISTTVRTAIVFAATPRGLAATAAGYNEASVALGARVGVIVSTILVGLLATRSLTSALAGRADIDARLAEFKTLVEQLNLPEFRATATAAATADKALYAAAYLDGVWITIAVSGVIAIIGAILAWVLVGPGDPLKTVFDMQEERTDTEPFQGSRVST